MIDPELQRKTDPARGSSALLTRVASFGEAVIIRQLLASYGIPSRTVSHLPHFLVPICVEGVAEVRVLVAVRHLARARDLIADHLRQGFRVVSGGAGGERGDRQSTRRSNPGSE